MHTGKCTQRQVVHTVNKQFLGLWPGNELNIVCAIFLRKIGYGTIAYSERVVAK